MTPIIYSPTGAPLVALDATRGRLLSPEADRADAYDPDSEGDVT